MCSICMCRIGAMCMLVADGGPAHHWKPVQLCCHTLADKHGKELVWCIVHNSSSKARWGSCCHPDVSACRSVNTVMTREVCFTKQAGIHVLHSHVCLNTITSTCSLNAVIQVQSCQFSVIRAHMCVDACALFSQSAAHTSRTVSLQGVLLCQAALCQPNIENLFYCCSSSMQMQKCSGWQGVS